MALITNLDTETNKNYNRGDPKALHALASFARPDNATAYAAGDVISDSDGDAAVIEFPKCGQSGQILRVHLTYEENNAAPPDLELFLFNEEPTNFVDNVALALATGDMMKLHALYELAGADAVVVNASVSPDGALIYNTANAANQHAYVTKDGGDSLYGILVTRSAFTPVSATKIGIHLELLADG